MRNLIILVLVLMICSSCSSTPSKVAIPLIDSTEHPPEGWTERWVNKVPCEAPCWENITPGKTSSREAEAELKKISYFQNIEISTKYLPGKGVIEWETMGNIGGVMVFDLNDDQKRIISINPIHNPIPLSKILQIYGDPDYVWATASQPPDMNANLIFGLQIIYIKYGMILRIKNDDINNIPILNSESNFTNVTFFPSTKDGYKEATNMNVENNTQIRKWEGIKDFQYYCTDYIGGKGCQRKK